MAITVEDGSGLSNAVAYITVAFANSYHEARGRTDWVALSDAACELAIVRATDYIDLRFGPRFRGQKKSKAQSLQWPRLYAEDNSGNTFDGADLVPRQLQKACAEYALIASRVGELAANPAPPTGTQSVTGTITAPSGTSGNVLYLREKVDSLETEVRYSDPKTNTRFGAGGLVSAFNIPEYPLADSWLMELIRLGPSRDLARG